MKLSRAVTIEPCARYRKDIRAGGDSQMTDPLQLGQLTTTAQSDAGHIFVSYSHYDRRWLNLLLVALNPYMRNVPTIVWDDGRIEPGARWEPKLMETIASARMFVLLVSQQFLHSTYIEQHELPAILHAAENTGATV